ncbi:hypothetical protein DFH08DRAFT_488098 [Mycena albidolilacea]|uniref:Secreted protein n=1 Tax=Mycena albidolilacea TaxID=1033008 RepID=A0AAD6Z5G4_9AGAR|nr:hypothetical protein DFH08DRAFT_488098 [Mycena albidolilacea]
MSARLSCTFIHSLLLTIHRLSSMTVLLRTRAMCVRRGCVLPPLSLPVSDLHGFQVLSRTATPPHTHRQFSVHLSPPLVKQT